jgi:hypothetical protein
MPVDDREGLVELVLHLPPPLVGQARRGNDQGALDEPPELEFLEGKPAHDCLPGTWVVGDQESDAGLGQQVRINRIQLVRQGIDL